MKHKVTIIMPAYNEEKKISSVIDGIKKRGFKDIVVVDDASTDSTNKIASSKDVVVLKHVLNRGLGGALGTGLQYCKDNDVDIAVTFDSDGQHDPDDLKKIIQPIINKKADFVIGSRLINPKGMPLIRKIGNFGLNVITYGLFGIWTTDSQSGLRAFSKKAINRMEVRTNRMEVSSEFFSQLRKKKLKYAEIPIKAIYSEYSMQKGQGSLNAFNIVFKLILKKLMR